MSLERLLSGTVDNTFPNAVKGKALTGIGISGVVYPKLSTEVVKQERHPRAFQRIQDSPEMDFGIPFA